MAPGLLMLATCIAIEHVSPIERYSMRQRRLGFALGLIGGTLGTGIAWPLQTLWTAVGIGPAVVLPVGDWLRPFGILGGGVHFLALLAAADFLRYWRHRAEHRFFWPIHAVHHSPHELHAANSLGHPFQAVPEFLMVTIPLSFIQLDGPALPMAVGLFSSFLTLYIHSPIDAHFGRARVAIVDNRFHRIHHSLEPDHIDRNFGVCFTLWDRLFGTAYWPKPNEWPKVGVASVAPPRNIREFLALPLRVWRPSRPAELKNSLAS